MAMWFINLKTAVCCKILSNGVWFPNPILAWGKETKPLQFFFTNHFREIFPESNLSNERK
ncbi:hypothetical protein AFK68_18945 [Hydrocoleum sp. CS-953]|nr:hypothetical protein AFK68_18945 [Hydrocoleum sp. CS-953]